MYRAFFKRSIDNVFSFCALLILAIPMVIFAIIKPDSKGPALFWLKWIGLHTDTFIILKFRSVYTETPSDMPARLPSDLQSRIMPMGKIYRKLSIWAPFVPSCAVTVQ